MSGSIKAILDMASYNVPLAGSGIYADTSVVFALFDKGNPHSHDLELFFERCARERVPLVISSLVLLEFEHLVLKGVFDRAGLKPGGLAKALASKGDYRQGVVDVLGGAVSLLRQYPNLVILPASLIDETEELRKSIVADYGLLPMEAAHYALTRAAGLNSIAVMDGGFARLEYANIYTLNREMLNCRAPGVTFTTLVPNPEFG